MLVGFVGISTATVAVAYVSIVLKATKGKSDGVYEIKGRNEDGPAPKDTFPISSFTEKHPWYFPGHSLKSNAASRTMSLRCCVRMEKESDSWSGLADRSHAHSLHDATDLRACTGSVKSWPT